MEEEEAGTMRAGGEEQKSQGETMTEVIRGNLHK